MAKANPKAYFTSPIAKISYKSVDKWAEHNRKYRPYFDTWQEAHDFMVEKSKTNLGRLKKAVAAEARHLAKLESMTAPLPQPLEPQP